MSFRRINQYLRCQITAHLSWAPSEVGSRNDEHHENVEGAGNINSSASCESVYLSLSQNVRGSRIQLLVPTLGHQAV